MKSVVQSPGWLKSWLWLLLSPLIPSAQIFFLLFPGQTFRNSLFSLFMSHHPCLLLFPSTWDKMLLVAITLLTAPPQQFSLKRKKKSLRKILWLSPCPRTQRETCPGDLFSQLPLAVSPCWLLILDALLSCCPGQPEHGWENSMVLSCQHQGLFTSQGHSVGLPRQINPNQWPWAWPPTAPNGLILMWAPG